MIDIHAHILPGVDDGSPDMEESVEMIRMAAESGVQYITATPHCNIPGMFDNYWDVEIRERFLELRREIEIRKIPIRVLTGMEVFATPELPRLLREKKVLTLNGSKYFLMEFDFNEDPWFCDNILDDCAAEGFIPVIAHPERYYFVQDYPDIVYGWREKGYATQVNKSSILGRFGYAVKETVDLLIEHNLVSCVASDAHSSEIRTPHMAEVKDYLIRNYGKEYADQVLDKNPRRIMGGKSLVDEEIIPFV